jgi:hypothetical protein
LGFLALAIGCAGVVAYQYSPLLTTSSYNVASGHLKRLGFPYRSYSSSNSRYRRDSYISEIQADFTYTTGGKTYSSTLMSVPVITFFSFGNFDLDPQSGKNTLTVRYDPSDPQKCVPAEVLDSFTKSAFITYFCVFLAGSFGLIMAGMSNMGGDTWRPAWRTDAY